MLPRLFVSAVLAAGLMHGTAIAQSQSNTADSSTTQSTPSLPQELKQKLEAQGFTDVKVVPGSYIVSAKDKQGDPITAIIGPNSMTVFSISTSADSDSTTGSGGSKSGNSK